MQNVKEIYNAKQNEKEGNKEKKKDEEEQNGQPIEEVNKGDQMLPGPLRDLFHHMYFEAFRLLEQFVKGNTQIHVYRIQEYT